MIPKSFSASALSVAETCMARYYAENILRTPRPNNLAADLGTAVHGALEMYVLAVYINKTQQPDLKFLLMLYFMSFQQTFDTVEPVAHEWYAQGLEMCKVWFARTDFSDREVLSVETKTNFLVKTSLGEIPFNYIYDRLDKIVGQEDTYEIVDYKTIRKNLTPQDLKKKIQARCYGLAGQIAYPNAKRIWVRFDLLRHESVATAFTRDENIATWKFIKALAEKIIAEPNPGMALPDGTSVPWPETLNAECGYCVRKTSCNLLMANVTGGGLWSLTTIEDRIDKRALLEYQRKAVVALLADLDEVIIEEASKNDTLEFETAYNVAKISQGSRRTVDAERVEHVVGAEVFMRYGGIRLTMADFTKMLKDKQLTPEQKAKLNGLVYRTPGELKVVVEPKNPIED